MTETIYLTVKVKIDYRDKLTRKDALKYAKRCVLSSSILGMESAKPISVIEIKKKQK